MKRRYCVASRASHGILTRLDCPSIPCPIAWSRVSRYLPRMCRLMAIGHSKLNGRLPSSGACRAQPRSHLVSPAIEVAARALTPPTMILNGEAVVLDDARPLELSLTQESLRSPAFYRPKNCGSSAEPLRDTSAGVHTFGGSRVWFPDHLVYGRRVQCRCHSRLRRSQPHSCFNGDD